jgi:RsiW-degrading membrane proteinase PrsW (M82 family)
MFSIISAGLAPGLALLSFFYLKDKYNSEPIQQVFKMFVLGALLVFPLMVLQYGIQEEMGYNSFINAFLVIGFSEEFFKWFIIYYTVYKQTEFSDLYDGIVYSVSTSLGFASLENLLYLFANGVETAIGRAILPVSSHALYGVIMGYYLGKAKINKSKRLLILSLFIPAMLHGIYNFIYLSIGDEWVYGIVPFMLFLWWYGLRKVKQANTTRPQNSYTQEK